MTGSRENGPKDRELPKLFAGIDAIADRLSRKLNTYPPPPMSPKITHTPEEDLPRIGEAWLQCLGLSKSRAKAVVRAHKAEQAELLAALQHLEAAATKFTIGCNCQTLEQDEALSDSLDQARSAIARATA
jgi:hypothetical protein